MGDVETERSSSRKKRKLTTRQGVVIGVATVAGLGLLTKLFSFLRRDKQPKNLSEAELETLEAVLSGDAASSALSAQAKIVRSTPKFANLEADDEELVHQQNTDAADAASTPETDASKSLETPHLNGEQHPREEKHENGDAIVAKSISSEEEVKDAAEPHLDSTEPPSHTAHSEDVEELIEDAEKLPLEDLEKLPAEDIEKLPIGDVEKPPGGDNGDAQEVRAKNAVEDVEANGNSVQPLAEDVAEKLVIDEPKLEQRSTEANAQIDSEVKPQPSEDDADELVFNDAEVKPQPNEHEYVTDAEVKPQSREDDAVNDAEVKPQLREHDAKVKQQVREDDDADVETLHTIAAEEPEILTKTEKEGKHESEASDEARSVDDAGKAQL